MNFSLFICQKLCIEILEMPNKHMTSKGRWVLVDFRSRRHITNIQRHSDVKIKRLINVGFLRQYDVATTVELVFQRQLINQVKSVNLNYT